MTVRAAAVLVLLASLARPGLAAEPAAGGSADALAESMRQARWSEGFEARLNLVALQPDGRRAPPLKLALIGQIGPALARLSVRGIAPEQVRHQVYLAELHNGTQFRLLTRGEHATDAAADAEPWEGVFHTGVTAWDLLGPWWYWPTQRIGGPDNVAGHDCTTVISLSSASAAPVQEVISCVDTQAKLSLRTQLFDGRHRLLRTMAVEKTVRKESGAMAAKRILITSADNSAIEVEVYGGDEHYVINAEAFSALDTHPAGDH